MNKYLFSSQLISGLIKSRPNRFIMLVEIKDKLIKCHCPSTGRIGNIEFKNIPCLLSKSKNKNRKTPYTVEAIIVDKLIIGINQTKANRYVEFFLKKNLLPKMIKTKHLRREVTLNKSRIDFLVNDNCFLEVKTLLIHLPFGSLKNSSPFNSFERPGKHFTEISNQIKKDQKAIVLLCYLYDAKPFETPTPLNPQIVKVVKKATDKGLEHWQINLKIDFQGVSLIKYFELKL